jgi:diguanylate cyclase (GGDEF)-like protein/PAS domain S-box-containing protein
MPATSPLQAAISQDPDRYPSLLEHAVDTTATHVAVIDAAGTIHYANQAWTSFSRMNGGSETTCGVGANYLATCEHVAPEQNGDALPVSAGLRALLAGTLTEFRHDYPCHSLDEQRWFQLRATAFRHNRQTYAIIIHENITAIKQQELQLQYCHQRFYDVVSAAGEFIWESDLDGRFTWLSEMVTRLTGYAPEELKGVSAFDLMPPKDARRVKSVFLQMAQAQAGFYALKHQMRHKNGSYVTIQVSGVPAFNQNEELVGYRGACMDITEYQRTLEKLERLALHDSLTGLLNRVGGIELLDRALADLTPQTGQGIAVLSVDIDFFNSVNESLGHEAGNYFLIRTARRLEQTVSADSTVCRFGNDKFILVSPHCTQASLAELSQKVLTAVAEPLLYFEQEICLTASIGIACAPRDSLLQDELLSYADMALKVARKQGRNQYAFFNPQLAVKAHTLMTLENRLRRAAERDAFQLVYQPQHHATTGAIIGMEALLRWNDQELGQVPPSEFIPLAEERGMIIPIGEWVLEHACQQIRHWMQAGILNIPLAINISPIQFRYPGFLKTVQATLGKCTDCINLIELELTESCLLDDCDNRATTILQLLKEMAFKLSLDDFGTGYSSLAHLRKLPIDRLKIDRSFITDLPDNHHAAGIVNTIIAMTRTLGLDVIAEGVEHPEQVAYLLRHDCPSMQGFYFNRPLPASEMTRLLAQ